jgi:PPOX class probable F420-dependent enzyme
MSQKLPLPSRIMAAQYKVFHLIRHNGALEVAREEGTATDFDHFRGARQCLLVTFKRSGEPVPTPVNFGLSDDGTVYFRSEPHVAKMLRIRRDPHVRVCPCSVRGKPRGALVEATARVLPESEKQHAYDVIAANWDPPTKLIEHGYDRIGVPAVYVELAPASATEARQRGPQPGEEEEHARHP